MIRKPVKTPDQVDIEKLINKGAAVKEDRIVESEVEEKKWIVLSLRISKDMLNSVDNAVSKRAGITRTGWILESIHDKLKWNN